MSNWAIDQSSKFELEYELPEELFEQRIRDSHLQGAPGTFVQQTGPSVSNSLKQLKDAESQYLEKSTSDSETQQEYTTNYSLPVKQKLLDREGGLEKADSFSRWATKELEDVDDLRMQSSSGLSWNTAECEDVVEGSSVSPVLSQDQLFSITDFSPKRACITSDVEVTI